MARREQEARPAGNRSTTAQGRPPEGEDDEGRERQRLQEQ